MRSGIMLKQISSLFKKHTAVKLAYFFGSRAKGEGGVLSDFDFAVYLDGKSAKEMQKIKLRLYTELSRVLKTDKIDIVILNLSKNSELKYNIITDGKLIFEREPFRVLVEPKILNEYFDFHYLLQKYGLTHA